MSGPPAETPAPAPAHSRLWGALSSVASLAVSTASVAADEAMRQAKIEGVLSRLTPVGDPVFLATAELCAELSFEVYPDVHHQNQSCSPSVVIGRDLIEALPADVRGSYSAIAVPGTSPAWFVLIPNADFVSSTNPIPGTGVEISDAASAAAPAGFISSWLRPAVAKVTSVLAPRVIVDPPIFVVIPGTSNIRDALIDLMVTTTTLPLRACSQLATPTRNMLVHSGFHSRVDSHIKAVRDVAGDAILKSRRRVIFTGHSLGGACALLLRHRLCTEADYLFERSAVYTFGAPLVFARSAADEPLALTAADFANVHCFVHEVDLVPRLLGSDAMRALVQRFVGGVAEGGLTSLATAQHYVGVGAWYHASLRHGTASTQTPTSLTVPVSSDESVAPASSAGATTPAAPQQPALMVEIVGVSVGLIKADDVMTYCALVPYARMFKGGWTVSTSLLDAGKKAVTLGLNHHLMHNYVAALRFLSPETVLSSRRPLGPRQPQPIAPAD